MSVRYYCIILVILMFGNAHSVVKQSKGEFVDKFRQLDEVLPTPNRFRNAAGEPGESYWQQKVDYKIKVKLDEKKRQINGEQDIIYHNESPYNLKYLWLQLDQNRFKKDSLAERSNAFGGIGRRGPQDKLASGSEPAKINLKTLRRQQSMADNDYGFFIENITSQGKKLPYTLLGTQLRIDLNDVLKTQPTSNF